MRNYVRTQVTELITVRSIVTVHYFDLRLQQTVGERHDFPEIFYVDNGFEETCIDGTPLTLQAGQLVIFAPNAYHGFEEPDGPGNGAVGIVSFESDSPLLAELYNRVLTLTAAQREQFSELLTLGLNLFENVDRRTGMKGMVLKPGADIRELQNLKNLLELFLLELYHANSNTALPGGANREHFKALQMEQLTAYLLERLDRTLTLEQMGEELGLSTTKLWRLVHEKQGCGPMAYFLQLKIEEAKRLLTKTSLNVTEVAERLGFSSVHYFSKMFKEKTGKTPSAYAKTVDRR